MKGRILVVDDEELICTLLERKLKKEGYVVATTTDPEEGLRKLKTSPFDVILTDLRMGKMDGLELLMRARKVKPECDVVIMTGFATVESARRLSCALTAVPMTPPSGSGVMCASYGIANTVWPRKFMSANQMFRLVHLLVARRSRRQVARPRDPW